MTDPYRNIRTRPIPEDRMVRNTAGGLAFELDDRARLRRFLILGTEQPTYYATSDTLTAEAAGVVVRMANDSETSGFALMDEIIDVSESGAAKSQNPTLLALAIATASDYAGVKTRALDAIPRVCRTFTMLADFLTYAQRQRGWGTGFMKAVARWYEEMPVEKLAVQAVKYRQRNGWTHRDVLRRCHPRIPKTDVERRAVIEFMLHGRLAEPYALDGWTGQDTAATKTIATHLAAMNAAESINLVRTAQKMGGLPWEALPTSALKDPDLWRQMIPQMPLGALLRNLRRFGETGATGTSQRDETAVSVASRLTNQDELLRARVHPVAILFALDAYRGGQGANPLIVDALDEAFNLSFGFVQPTGGRTLVALDCSGSMDFHHVQTKRGKGMVDTGISAREAAAAMALVTCKAEDDYQVVGFTGNGRSRTNSGLMGFSFTKRSTVAEVMNTTRGVPFGGTDCALPARYAQASGQEFDTIIIYTDNEHWAGEITPSRAITEYRNWTGKPVRQIVVAMTATAFSIADPQDPFSLDVVGFDAGAPRIMSEFARV